MARIRTIKPEAFTSETLSSVPRGCRWTFAGLWTYVDDAGVGEDNARLIWAALYPLDDTTSIEDVSEDLDGLARIGAICRYTVDGKRYFHIVRWQHQVINKPSKSRRPACPSHRVPTPSPDTSHTTTGIPPEGYGVERSMEHGSGTGSMEHGMRDALAEEIHSLRPDWDTAGIRAALDSAAVRCPDAHQLAVAARACASLQRIRTPGLLAQDGPWWDIRALPPASRGTCTEHLKPLPCNGCAADRLVASDA